jgi:hypothetical protein
VRFETHNGSRQKASMVQPVIIESMRSPIGKRNSEIR